jgi:hypothetical protein
VKYSARYVQSFPVNLPAEKIDLYKWLTEMTDADYRFPATVSAYWEPSLAQNLHGACELTSLVRIDFPNALLKLGGRLNGFGGFFLNRHIKHEGKAFARDLEKTFK